MSPSPRTSGVQEQARACQRPTFPKYDSRPLSVLPLVGLQWAQRIRRTILFIARERVREGRPFGSVTLRGTYLTGGSQCEVDYWEQKDRERDRKNSREINGEILSTKLLHIVVELLFIDILLYNAKIFIRTYKFGPNLVCRNTQNDILQINWI